MQGYEDIQMLLDAEELADSVWRLVTTWDHFGKDTVAKQWVRATVSIGANIAEAFGRFHYGEKINFLYFARGSTFEAKYWTNRALKRTLISQEQHQFHAASLTSIAKQINGFAKSLKSRRANQKPSSALREADPAYPSDGNAEVDPIFTEHDLDWLNAGDSSDEAMHQTIYTNPFSTLTP